MHLRILILALCHALLCFADGSFEPVCSDAIHSDELTFGRALRVREIREARELVKKEFEAGEIGAGEHKAFLSFDPSQRIIFVAKAGETVVGTVSLVTNGIHPLLISSLLVRNFGVMAGVTAQVTALAIEPRFRKAAHKVLIPLLGTLFRYTIEKTDFGTVFISIHPRHLSFYRDVLLFEELTEGQKDSYDGANGKPVVTAALSVRKAHMEYRQRRDGGHSRLYSHFVVDWNQPAGVFPQRLR